MHIRLLIVEIALIVLVARIGGIVLRLLRQPEVIGEMLGGLVLGPSVLGLLDHGRILEKLFPPHAISYLNVFSQGGLIFFMFMIGLELDLRTLIKRGKSVLGMGLASILIPFAAGIAISALILKPEFSPHTHSHIAFILMTAAAIGASAFPVMARILADQGITRTNVGQFAVASAAVIDVTGWCLLAVVYDIAQTQMLGHGSSLLGSLALGLKTLGLAISYTIVMMFFVPRFLWRFHAHFESRSEMTRDVLAMLLLLLLISSIFTEMLGINLIFGAFMMGAILPSDARFVKYLTSKLEDVTLLLLMPVFFTTIGLHTNIAMINTAPLWQTWAWLLAAMVLVKVIVGTIAAKFTGLSLRESTLMGFLINTHGVMELIILNLAWQMHAIDSRTMAMLVLALLSATVLSTPFISLLARPLRRIGFVGPEADNESAPQAHPRQRILLCISQSHTAPALVRIADILLGGKPGRVQALQLQSPDSWHLSDIASADHNRVPLDFAVDEARKLNLRLATSSFPSRHLSRDICRTAEHTKAGWIIIGSHSGILDSSSLGGVTGQVLKNAPCDVAILVHKNLQHVRQVLVPYIGEPQDAGALLAAQCIGENHDVHITIVHVVRPSGGTSTTDPTPASGVKTLVEKYLPSVGSGNQVRMQVIENDSPAEVVVRESVNYDLIILGTSPQWQLRQKLLGKSQTSVAQRSSCSVLIVQTNPKASTASATSLSTPTPADPHASTPAPV